MMLRAIRWGSGPRDAQSKGRFGALLGRHSIAGLHNCLLLQGGNLDNLTLSQQ